MDDYNIHCLLYDITRGHFKSKWLCKHNKHNYQLHAKVKCIPEISYEYSPDGRSIICKHEKYNKFWTTYYKCYCCGKEKDLERKWNKLKLNKEAKKLYEGFKNIYKLPNGKDIRDLIKKIEDIKRK